MNSPAPKWDHIGLDPWPYEQINKSRSATCLPSPGAAGSSTRNLPSGSGLTLGVASMGLSLDNERIMPEKKLARLSDKVYRRPSKVCKQSSVPSCRQLCNVSNAAAKLYTPRQEPLSGFMICPYGITLGGTGGLICRRSPSWVVHSWDFPLKQPHNGYPQKACTHVWYQNSCMYDTWCSISPPASSLSRLGMPPIRCSTRRESRLLSAQASAKGMPGRHPCLRDTHDSQPKETVQMGVGVTFGVR